MLTLFTLPADAVTTTTAYIGELITDAGGFIFLGIGLPLAFYVVKKIMGIIPKR